MYTSGTTGDPKGVMIPHQGITRLVVDPNYINIQTDDCIAQLANIAFDAATFEIWGALLNGACIVVIDKKTALDTAKLSKAIADNRVTIMFLTTALFNQHTNCDTKCYKGLRYLLFGGEAASVNSVRSLYQSGDKPENLIHVYGPTENTTFSTFYRIDSMPAAGKPLPIGGGISNCTSFVVDPSMQITDDHRQGELLLGGKGLALGYLNNQDLTDRKFFRPPWSEELFYRTGDIVGLTDTGSYYFVGRTDNQVKIRGFRIELEEIELALDSHPHIDMAIVMPVDEGAWDTKQLVAYLSASGEPGLPELGEIRSWLKGILPGYMIPSRFYEVSEVPLSPTGKVLRSALDPSIARLVTDQTVSTGALTDIERVIRDLWAGSLHYSPEDIRLDDNFFELGGDSLLSVQIAHEIRVLTGVELPIEDLFENPTVKSLAESVQSNSKTRSTPMARWNGKGPLPLSPYQEQIWLHQQQDPNAPFYNEPLSITMHEEINVASLKLAIYHLVERHQALRTRIIIGKQGVVQHFASMNFKRFDDEFNYFDLRHLPIDVARKEAVIQATRQAIRIFDLENDQPIRFCLVRFAQKSFKLFMTAHHLIIDGVAIYRVFLPELHQVYHALITGTEIGLSDFDFSYADWLLWIDRAQEQIIEKHATFWEKQLDGVTSVQLPTDNLHAVNNTFTGEVLCLSIPADLVSLLRTLSRKQGATMFMVMLTAFKVLLKKYTQQNDLAVVTSVANRNLPGTEKFVSDMVNTLLLRTNLPDQGSFKDMLCLVRQTCLQAFSHQQISLQQVLRRSGIGKKENSLINVAFVFEPAMNHDNIDWELSQLDIHTSSSKFDLAMELDERGGEIIGRVEYNTGLFEAQTIKRLV
ncbi:MAG: AMP-binding protein, partial [bacterium]|nr:AMP-binding protein [bacterium]